MVTKSQKKKKHYFERKVGEYFQWKAIGHCSTGNSCSFSHRPASASRCEAQRRKGEQSSPAPDSKARTDSEKNFSAQEKEVLRTIEGEFRAVLDIVQTRRAMIGILPCVKITSPKRSAKMANDALFDKLRRRRIPTTSQRKVVQKDQLLH